MQRSTMKFAKLTAAYKQGCDFWARSYLSDVDHFAGVSDLHLIGGLVEIVIQGRF